MICLLYESGNHSNRLFQTIHFEAYCKEYNHKFLNLCFEDMKELYGQKKNVFARIFRFFLIRKPLRKLIRVVDFDKEDSQSSLVDRLNRQKISFVGGWYFRRHDLTLKYRKYFQNRYLLCPSYYSTNTFVQDVLSKKNNEVLVGIHLRRGDYKTWEDGRYYFEDSVFLEYISHMEEKIKEKNIVCKFILFSNESISIPKRENLVLSKEKWYIDQYIMSKCDYLIGPPSTFTGWASYIGEVPLLYMQTKDATFSLDDFKIING